jgi:hypothetical protein
MEPCYYRRIDTLSTAVGEYLNIIGKEKLAEFDRLKAERDREKDEADRDYESAKQFLKRRKEPREAFLDLEERHRLKVERIQREFQEGVRKLLEGVKPTNKTARGTEHF